jgi:hypothetical protein
LQRSVTLMRSTRTAAIDRGPVSNCGGGAGWLFEELFRTDSRIVRSFYLPSGRGGNAFHAV